MKKVILILGCVVLLGGVSQSFADPGDTDADLVFTPATPCRIIDTRGTGAIGNGTTRDFMVAGTAGFDLQGGNSGGCGIPDDATAVMINFVAVGPAAPGDLRAWPYGGTMPLASIINFASVPGLNIANALIQPICNPAVATCTYDLTVLAEGSDVQVVADVTGYFRRFPVEQMGTITALEARIAALEAKLTGLTRSGGDFVISGANLHIQSGSGTTGGVVNGKGNLIIGYNESRGPGDIRTGSHNLIVGSQNDYSSYGGIVVGWFDAILAPYASVSGGAFNTASGYASSVSGGYGNTASGDDSSVSGGGGNTASAEDSSVSGGAFNTASGYASSVSGGHGNTANGDDSSVSGGLSRSAPNAYDWRGGGLIQDY